MHSAIVMNEPAVSVVYGVESLFQFRVITKFVVWWMTLMCGLSSLFLPIVLNWNPDFDWKHQSMTNLLSLNAKMMHYLEATVLMSLAPVHSFQLNIGVLMETPRLRKIFVAKCNEFVQIQSFGKKVDCMKESDYKEDFLEAWKVESSRITGAIQADKVNESNIDNDIVMTADASASKDDTIAHFLFPGTWKLCSSMT